MTTPRKSYSAAFKAQLVQELLKEEQTLPQIVLFYFVVTVFIYPARSRVS